MDLGTGHRRGVSPETDRHLLSGLGSLTWREPRYLKNASTDSFPSTVQALPRAVSKTRSCGFRVALAPLGLRTPTARRRRRESQRRGWGWLERPVLLLSMCDTARMLSAAGRLPLRATPVVAAAAAAAAAPPPPHTPRVAGLDERPQQRRGRRGEEEEKAAAAEEVTVFVVSLLRAPEAAATAVVVGGVCEGARVPARPARGDEAAARMMMCAATASPAAASSGPGGDGFFAAATMSSSPAPGALFMPVSDGSVAAAGLGLGLPATDSRGHYQLLLSGRALADRYRRIYTTALSDRDQAGSGSGHPASR